MAEETTDKSIVVWYPSSPFPDPREWTSLCLFHEQVLFYTTFTGELEKFDGLVVDETSSDLEKRVAFLDVLNVLAKENLVRLITYEETCEAMDVLLNRCESHPDVIFDSFIERCNKGGDVTTEGLRYFELVGTYEFSKAYVYPLATDDNALLDSNTGRPAEELSGILAQCAICQLALPDVKAIHVEDLLEARTELRDELLEFRAGILKLTWLLHQQVQNKNDLEQIRQEANTLTDTIIKGSLLSLENRMRQHKKKTIRRMLFGTGRVLVEATKLFLPSGTAEKMISGGKSFLQLATEIDGTKLPEDQVATYLYKLKGKLS